MYRNVQVLTCSKSNHSRQTLAKLTTNIMLLLLCRVGKNCASLTRFARADQTRYQQVIKSVLTKLPAVSGRSDVLLGGLVKSKRELESAPAAAVNIHVSRMNDIVLHSQFFWVWREGFTKMTKFCRLALISEIRWKYAAYNYSNYAINLVSLLKDDNCWDEQLTRNTDLRNTKVFDWERKMSTTEIKARYRVTPFTYQQSNQILTISNKVLKLKLVPKTDFAVELPINRTRKQTVKN